MNWTSESVFLRVKICQVQYQPAGLHALLYQQRLSFPDGTVPELLNPWIAPESDDTYPFMTRPKKSWGQHFLHDQAVRARIVEHARISPDDEVIELGGGAGFLTEALAGIGAPLFVAEVEFDALETLRQRFGNRPNVSILHADATDIQLDKSGTPGKRKIVVGNLPYQAASPILFNLAEQTECMHRAVVMVQKEMALRMAAPTADGRRGALGINLETVFDVRKLFDVRPGAFTPPPKVQSSVVLLTPARREYLAGTNLTAFRLFVQHLFSFRRKTLRSALRHILPAGQSMEKAGLAFSLDARAEDLSTQNLAALFTASIRTPRVN